MQFDKDGVTPIGKLDIGLEYLRNGLRDIPDNPYLLYNYACINEMLMNFKQAQIFFNFCLEITPNWSDALYGIALCHFKQEDYKIAKKVVNKAIFFHSDYDQEEEMMIKRGDKDKDQNIRLKSFQSFDRT